MTKPPAIAALLREDRSFPPTDAFRKAANVSDPGIYDAGCDLERFWAEQAHSFEWFRKWHQVLEWKSPFAKWFLGGKLNITVNCLDRHLKTWRRNKAAFI